MSIFWKEYKVKVTSTRMHQGLSIHVFGQAGCCVIEEDNSLLTDFVSF